jgi:hypothetical protein
MHKIRTVIGKRYDKYTLEGSVELDEGYFEISAPSNVRLKRGRGSQSKTNVAVMAEPSLREQRSLCTLIEDIETGEKSSQFRYAKMKVLTSHKATDINDVAKNNIEKESLIITDKSTSNGS